MENKTILAVDSTATTASVAVRKDGKTVGVYSVDAGNTHSVTLLPMIEHMLKSCNLTVEDIDIYAVSQGPGSFTGVRIGASVVKGLAFAKQTSVVGVSTLEALAYNMRMVNGIVCPCMNARRGQVYTALFESDGEKICRITEDMAISVEELEEKLKVYSDVYITGDGYSLAEHLTKKVTPEFLRGQNAASVAILAEKMYNEAEDKTFHPDMLVPTYLRKPQAEREREERLKNND